MVGEQLPGHIIRDIRVASASFSLSTSQTWSTPSLVNTKDLSAGQLLMQLVSPAQEHQRLERLISYSGVEGAVANL